MTNSIFAPLLAALDDIDPVQTIGRVVATGQGVIDVAGLSKTATLGDRVLVKRRTGQPLEGEVLRLAKHHVSVLLTDQFYGVSIGDIVTLQKDPGFHPDPSWIGRVICPNGQPLDGRPLVKGPRAYPLLAPPPAATRRRGLGGRMETGMKLFNTLLPFACGQRVGLFAGSGIGKSTLIGQFARTLAAEVVVIGLVGERGREVGAFVGKTLGETGMARSVVIAATSDQSPLLKRRAAWAAMAVAEYFRDQGKQVLLVLDSLTRFAEAHRDIALAAGESASMRGFPPSTSSQIMGLCERAGPGVGDAGDITAIFSVLVAGSDMDEPVADITRGVLDGHIVLDRQIAERGRFPAVDVLRSVSRSLPEVATPDENRLISKARHMLGVYDASELMIRAGLYSTGSDPKLDRAVEIWPGLDAFAGRSEIGDSGCSFRDLREILADPETHAEQPSVNPPKQG